MRTEAFQHCFQGDCFPESHCWEVMLAIAAREEACLHVHHLYSCLSWSPVLPPKVMPGTSQVLINVRQVKGADLRILVPLAQKALWWGLRERISGNLSVG